MVYLTWDNLADFYKNKTGRNAKIQPMQKIYSWAVKQEEIVEDSGGLKLKTKIKKEITCKKKF